MKNRKTNQRRSLRLELIVLFGLLLTISLFIMSYAAIRIVRDVVIIKSEKHLLDKAISETEVIDQRLINLIQFIEAVARNPIIDNNSMSYLERAKSLNKEKELNKYIKVFGLCNTNGKIFTSTGIYADVSDRQWYQHAMTGNTYISSPQVSREDGSLAMTIAVPIYKDGKINGVLIGDLDGFWLSDTIKDLKIAETGACCILDTDGTSIADEDPSLVTSMFNVIKESQENENLSDIGNFFEKAIESEAPGAGYYTYGGQRKIAAYSKMKQTGWVVLIYAPDHEFLGSISYLRKLLVGIGFGIFVISFIIIFIFSYAIVNPITQAVSALKSISEGDGDLRAKLEIKGRNEIADMSYYFNKTMEKIRISIQTVLEDSNKMNSIGDNLSSNMFQTADSIRQISSNIDGVKQDVIKQNAGVAETSATMEEIIRTIEQLNANIEKQVNSVSKSSSSIEEMVANIGSITQTLGQTDDSINRLTRATGEGKENLHELLAKVKKPSTVVIA